MYTSFYQESRASEETTVTFKQLQGGTEFVGKFFFSTNIIYLFIIYIF